MNKSHDRDGLIFMAIIVAMFCLAAAIFALVGVQ
jgi:hypothetical protein